MNGEERRYDIYSALQAHTDRLLKRDVRPNILFLLTDQQRFDTICAAGYPHMKTPNLDRLVREGRLYENACTPNPICCPARHNLITGLPARFHGIADNEFGKICDRSLPTLPALLAESGYDCRMIGKTHYVPTRQHNGFSRLELMDEVPEHREDDDYLLYLKEKGYGQVQNIHGVRNLLYMAPQRSLLPDEHHGSKWVADRCIDYIAHADGKRPFFLFAGWIAPHPPFDVPECVRDAYRDAILPEPSESNTPLCAMAEENMAWGDLTNERMKRRMRECYYAQITHVDMQIGRILDALDASDLSESTLVMFTSDHGEMLGDLGCYQKFLPYDAASRIPMIMRFPGRIPAGSREENYVNLNDIMPTLLDAANVEYPGPRTLPGESLLTDNPKKDRTHQYVEYARDTRRWISMRNRRFKYNYFFGGGREELFDMQKDPRETTNLLETDRASAYEDIRRDLRARLIAHEFRWGLEGGVKDGALAVLPAYVPNPHRNSSFPIFPKMLSARERAEIGGFFDEVLRAVAGEDSFELSELDIESWLQNRRIPAEGKDAFLNTIGLCT